MNEYRSLTGIRFFAAFYVLLFHYGAFFIYRLGAPDFVVSFLRHGYLGVSLFFILSGFILTHAYNNIPLHSGDLVRFYASRFARIYPVYILALILALPMMEKPLSISGALSVIFMYQAWTLPQSESGYYWVMQAWTLSVEFFFYIFAPLYIAVSARMSAVVLIILFFLTTFLMIYFGLSSIAPGHIELDSAVAYCPIPVLRSAEFIYGIVLYRMMNKFTRTYEWIRQRESIFEILLTLMIIALLSLCATACALAMVSVLFGLLILVLCGGKGVISRFFSSKIMLLLGGASYSIYLLQNPVRAICGAIFPNPLDKYISPVVIISLSICVFIYIEKPMRNFILSCFGVSKR